MLAARRLRESCFGSVSAGVMPGNALIDTGPILALLDRSDRWDRACLDAFGQLRRRFPRGGRSGLEVGPFRGVGSATIEEVELQHLHDLMYRYWDGPMDFADATLVYLAKRESLFTILTVDHADFETYRIEGRRRFRVLPVHRV
jgi:uncharacterized protein